MTEIWGNISYMVQLLLACILFVIPARKRKYFIPLSAIGGIILLISAYEINQTIQITEECLVPFAYWGFYLCSVIIFSWLCLDGNLAQVLYCAIIACAMQHIAFDVYRIETLLGISNPIFFVIGYAMVYIIIFLFVARKLPENGRFILSVTSIVPMVTMIMLMWGLSILEDSSLVIFQASTWSRILYRILDGVCCFYVMWVQMNQKEKSILQRELNSIQIMAQQQKEQYEITSETIEVINRKCHDLKHQIRVLREMSDDRERAEYFDEIENAIMIYDTALSTGNHALDIVLMEKGMFCRSHGIQWSCMADGKNLNFMKEEDIYAMFGNALNNAIDAVMNLEEEKKVISVKIICQNQIIVIQIQNYYAGEITMRDGIPLTTKEDKNVHGYGVKSIRYTAEKYNGVITLQASNQIFTLQILIPVKE